VSYFITRAGSGTEKKNYTNFVGLCFNNGRALKLRVDTSRLCLFIETETSSKKRVFPKLDFIQHVYHSEIRFHQRNVPLKILGFV